MTTPNPPEKRISLRYAATCSACGSALAKGGQALYDPASMAVRCVDCPSDGERPDDAPIEVGEAGASARREYERRKDRRETRMKDRFGRRVGGVILAITDEPQSMQAWARGAAGEAKLAQALSDVEGIAILHDRRVPGTRGNIDHIVVAPAGVFVIDAKRYEGLIRIRDVGGFFRRDERLYVGSRDCSKLAENMAWQAEAVERALTAAQVDPLPPIVPVLCFVDGEWPLLSPPKAFAGVRLEGARSIKKLVSSGDALDAMAVGRLTRILAAGLPSK